MEVIMRRAKKYDHLQASCNTLPKTNVNDLQMKKTSNIDEIMSTINNLNNTLVVSNELHEKYGNDPIFFNKDQNPKLLDKLL
jgi:hypothetical protein